MLEESSSNPYPETGSPSARDLGRAIRQLRWERDLTIEALAFASEIHPTYLSGIERTGRNPSWGRLCAIADALGLPIVEVVRHAESAERGAQGRREGAGAGAGPL